MAKKQSRRSVSLNKGEWERAHEVAERCGVSLAHFTEVALRAFIMRGPVASWFVDRIVVDDPIGHPQPGPVPTIDQLIQRSSIGEGMQRIAEHGVEAECERPSEELAEFSLEGLGCTPDLLVENDG